jgi:hypothetical protein
MNLRIPLGRLATVGRHHAECKSSAEGLTTVDISFHCYVIAEMRNKLAAEGIKDNLKLLLVVLESAVTLHNCPNRARNEMDIPNARKKTMQQASSTQSTKPCVPITVPGKAKATSEARRRIRDR